MKTTIINVDEAIARGNYNWKKLDNDCEFKGYFPGYTTGFCLEYIKDGQIVYGGMTCTDDFDEILVPSQDHNTPWNDLGISAECASFNGCIPTGTIVFRGYFTKQYDWHEREEYVVDASKEVMDLFEKYVVA